MLPNKEGKDTADSLADEIAMEIQKSVSAQLLSRYQEHRSRIVTYVEVRQKIEKPRLTPYSTCASCAAEVCSALASSTIGLPLELTPAVPTALLKLRSAGNSSSSRGELTLQILTAVSQSYCRPSSSGSNLGDTSS